MQHRQSPSSLEASDVAMSEAGLATCPAFLEGREAFTLPRPATDLFQMLRRMASSAFFKNPRLASKTPWRFLEGHCFYPREPNTRILK